MWCTSRASPDSTTSATRRRSFVRTRWWCTAETSSSDGIGAIRWSESRSDSTSVRAPAAIASDASRRTRSIADASASAPPSTSYSPERTLQAKPGRSPSSLMWMSLASSSLSMTGYGSLRWRQDAGPGARRLRSGPMIRAMQVTSSSRIASSGGLVTCAKFCLK